MLIHILRLPHFFIISLAVLFGLQANFSLAISEKKAAEIGKKMYEEITAEMPIYIDKKLNDYVSGVGQKLIKYSDQPDLNYTFTIIDSPDINAFATPGAYIYVNRGLLAYMNSEAQLAAVLGHELAHVTADHASRQKNAQTGSNVVAGLLAVLTGSADVGEASAMWGAATVKGYGRDMELEADAIGAKTMARAGYPVDAMITIISQLKDHERFMKKRNKDSGKKTQSYHGIFSSHPRNDKRLREIVKKSGADLDSSKTGDPGIVPFRVATQNLPWGQTTQTPARQDKRYYDDKLNFSFDYPDGWQFQEKAKQVLGNREDDSASLVLDVKARTLDSPEQYIKKVLGISFIKKSESTVVNRLKGHTGTIPGKNNANDIRIAVIYYGRHAFVFRGIVDAGSALDNTAPKIGESSAQSYDAEFKSIIASFQPRSPRRSTAHTGTIKYVKASSSATYAKLARQLNLGKYGKDQLQLINGHYPGSEPQAGQWIKIIR
ncbi:MAG: M48 family metalloprotease [Porticoccaceae bacterium]|nr:M48 family metalloprotease [Porticoccaceae bacterium]